MCLKDPSELRDITLSELKLHTVEKDTILWVTSISRPSQMSYVLLVVEDRNKDVSSLMLYNQINYSANIDHLQTCFPAGMRIGIKQPYLKLSYNGVILLINDNPQNVVFEGLAIDGSPTSIRSFDEL